MPKTRSFGKPETLFATWHIASSGFETTIEHRVRRLRDHDLLGDGADDLLVRRHEVVAAHARRAGRPAVIDDDVRAGRLLVAVRADDGRLVAEDGAHLVDVERLALRQSLLDVDEHDVRVVARREHLRARRADVARADDRDLLVSR